jgi:hypothetical protein
LIEIKQAFPFLNEQLHLPATPTRGFICLPSDCLPHPSHFKELMLKLALMGGSERSLMNL